jgi:hypothetical protein
MRNVAVIGERMEDLAHASAILSSAGASVLAVQAAGAAGRARSLAPPPEALVLFLTERDSLADLREVLARVTRALLVSPRTPPSAALAKVAAACGASLCGGDDALAVREALLIALARSLQEVAS